MAEVGSVIVRAWGAVIKGGLVGRLCNPRFTTLIDSLAVCIHL
jgi:hypothetical protein